MYFSPSRIALAELCKARAVAKYVWGYDAEETPETISAKHSLTARDFEQAQARFTTFLREDRPAMEKRALWRSKAWPEQLYDDISLHAKAEEGKRLHKLIQDYLYTGAVPDTEETAAHACIKALPVGPGSVFRQDIERVVLLPGMHGYIDWQRASKQGDLKFTVDVKHQQAKTPNTDPQRIIYAVDAFTNDRSLLQLKQFWTVTQFTGKRALTLKHVWDKHDALKQYDKVVKPVNEFLQEAEAKQLHWQDAPKNQASCDTYPPNGCIMKQHGCKRNMKDRLAAIRPKRAT